MAWPARLCRRTLRATGTRCSHWRREIGPRSRMWARLARSPRKPWRTRYSGPCVRPAACPDIRQRPISVDRGPVTLIVLLILYSVALILLGTWAGRAVRGASDFFVAGRSLGP